MRYPLDHLSQETTEVFGPIQDDEGLLLFALIRAMGLKYIVEIGGLFGYSAQNFCIALGSDGKVITIDPNFRLQYNIDQSKHMLIKELAHTVLPSSLKIPRIDLLFFDAHDDESQMKFYHNMVSGGLITEETIIVLHDTGTHGIKINPNEYEIFDNRNGNYGYYPIKIERDMSNTFMDLGYCALHVHANNKDLPDYIKIRHGITILQKPYKLL